MEVTEKQVAINILIEGVWHRVFELKEAGERHIMAWKGCPLNEIQGINPEVVVYETLGLETIGPSKACPICYEDELKDYL